MYVSGHCSTVEDMFFFFLPFLIQAFEAGNTEQQSD
jgi:hypothetical protein